MEKKRCKKCGEEKDLDCFYKHPNTQDKLDIICKECNKERSKNWARSNKEKRKFIWLKHKYGISKEKYLSILEEQQGKCAICGKDDGEFPNRLNVDHHHLTGEVRGLLCNSCNQGIGYFQESTELLSSAKKYMEKWNSTKVSSA